MNGFEEKIINEIANLNSIAFWTRNLEKKGFCINGYLNHYPDFMVYEKREVSGAYNLDDFINIILEI